MALIQSKFQYDKEQGNRHRRRHSDQNVDFIEEQPLEEEANAQNTNTKAQEERPKISTLVKHLNARY